MDDLEGELWPIEPKNLSQNFEAVAASNSPATKPGGAALQRGADGKVQVGRLWKSLDSSSASSSARNSVSSQGAVSDAPARESLSGVEADPEPDRAEPEPDPLVAMSPSAASMIRKRPSAELVHAKAATKQAPQRRPAASPKGKAKAKAKSKSQAKAKAKAKAKASGKSKAKSKAKAETSSGKRTAAATSSRSRATAGPAAVRPDVLLAGIEH